MNRETVVQIAVGMSNGTVPYLSGEQEILAFAAAILLEAAKVCDCFERKDSWSNAALGWCHTTTPPDVISSRLKEMAKELTQ